MQLSIATVKAIIFSILIMFFLPLLGSAQSDQKWDEKASHFIIDSLFLKKRATKPLKAILLSAVLPGAGQIYNRQYYKLHLVYGAIGGMIYAIDYNTRQFKIYDEAYRTRLAGGSSANFPDFIPDASIANRRDDFRKSKETAYFGLGIVYLLNVADAFVSAHLTTFDIKDDLITGRLKLLDTMEFTGQAYPTIGVTLSF